MWQFLFYVWILISVVLSCGAFYEFISRYDLADRKLWAAVFFLSWLWPVALAVFVLYTCYEMLADLQKPTPERKEQHYYDYYP